MRARFELFLLMTLVSMLLVAGCAQQDLYEPPGTNFTRIGTVPLPSQNEGVALIGRHAFVAGGQAGLHSIDFTDPSHPYLVQTINTLKYSESVEVARTFVDHTLQDIAFVVEGTEGVTSYDITDPSNMISFNSNTTAVFGNRVFIEEPTDPEEPFVLYLAESWKGVRIFETIPAQPGILAYNGVFVGTQGYAEGIAVRGGYAYVADDEMGLAVLDVLPRDLDAVELVSWADTPGEALDVEISGDYAYVADGYEGLAIFRINGGETPVKVAQLPLESKSRAVGVRDNLCVLAAQGGGVHFVDISDPSDPIFLGREATEYAMDLAISDEGYILIADRDEGLIIFEGHGPFADHTPPAPILSLNAETFSAGAIRLSWYATGDDGMYGQASSLEIRMSDAPITDETSWAAATLITSPPAPEMPGTEMDYVVTDLAQEEVHFAIRFTDDAGLNSDLSNPVSATPGAAIVLWDPSLNLQQGSEDSEFTYEVTYYFPTPPTVHDVIIDGTAHQMTAVPTKGDDTTYRYTTQLAPGPHTYSFRFESADPEIPAVSTEEFDGPVVGLAFFQMGSPDDELGRGEDEWQHMVVFLDGLFEAMPTEVTQAQWMAQGFANPSHFVGDNLPVDSVTWFQAVEYCNALSVAEGLTPVYEISGAGVTWDKSLDGYRLPTEAEWEYLCRAESSEALANGPLENLICNDDPNLNAMGWYCGSTFTGFPSTNQVQLKGANAFDLYDMHGNVWEWCWDFYGDYRLDDENGDGVITDPNGPEFGDRRVLRGGSWYGSAEDCRSANRSARYPDNSDDVVGFRVVRTIFSE